MSDQSANGHDTACNDDVVEVYSKVCVIICRVCISCVWVRVGVSVGVSVSVSARLRLR